MTWERSRYPNNWKEIARAAKEQAGWRCARCDPSDLATGQRCHLHVQTIHRPGQQFLPGLEEAWVGTVMARQTAAVRAEAARQMRRPGPAIQQVFLPGMPGTPGGPVILPVASQEEVEL